MGRLPKLTDLFEEGTVVPLTTNAGTEMLVWLNKLTPFETEQANHEGRVARARMMLAIREIGNPEYDLFMAGAAESPPDALIASLVSRKANEHLLKVMRSIQSDAEWTERLQVLQWSADQLDGRADDDPEVQALAKVLDEYQAEIAKGTKALEDQLRHELQALAPDVLLDHYRDSYIEERGLAAFTVEQQKSQVFCALRRCEAVKDADGVLDHSGCNHAEKWLESRDEVNQLPPLLLDQVREAYMKLNMSPDIARFTDALASSSASSGRPSKPEDSAPSGPEATPATPAGTSS